jgi:hypothetical protein
MSPDPHPLLAQLPLTVSPFISLPTATTLPYTYKSLPSTLPPSMTDPAPTSNQPPHPEQQQQAQPAYVVSQATGHAAHPDQIIASCHALQAHLAKLQDDAMNTVQKWQDGIKERELMEKRRVAPGWLDVDQTSRMLVPERAGGEAHTEGSASVQTPADNMDVDRPRQGDGGEELDRAFGGLGLR